MKSRFGLTLILIIVCLSIGLASVAAQDGSNGLTIDTLNVRSGPGAEYGVMTEISPRVRVVIESRNVVGNWILIRTPDTAIRGWVASRYVAFDEGTNLDDLVVTEETFGAPTTAAPASEVTPSPVSNEPTNGMTIDRLNIRSGPGVGNTALTQIAGRARVVIEARNGIGDWILIHNDTNTIRGWVASRYVAFDEGTNLNDLVVTEAMVAAAPVNDASPAVPGGEPGNIDALYLRLWNTPVFYQELTGTVYSIFRRGQALGNQSHVFMKVGDSITALQPFLLGFGMGLYDLGNYGYLQETVNYFSVPLNSGDPNSFIRYSIAASEGYRSSAVLDPTWTNPSMCPTHREPLLCEYNLNKPAIAFVLFGPIDVQFSTADAFRGNMTRITQELVNNGMIPVLSTFPSTNWFNWEDSLIYNNIVLDVAEQFDVPLINLWRATQELPGQGVNDDGFHLSTGRTQYIGALMHTDEMTPYRFYDEVNYYGITVRNLLTLQMLDHLRVNVLGG